MQTKGVKVKPLLYQPWLLNSSFRVFTSSSVGQAALVLDEARTGLFTYFLAMGLRGKADLNGDGHVTAGIFIRTSLKIQRKSIRSRFLVSMETILLSFISVSYFTSIEISKDFFSFACNNCEVFMSQKVCLSQIKEIRFLLN